MPGSNSWSRLPPEGAAVMSVTMRPASVFPFQVMGQKGIGGHMAGHARERGDVERNRPRRRRVTSVGSRACKRSNPSPSPSRTRTVTVIRRLALGGRRITGILASWAEPGQSDARAGAGPAVRTVCTEGLRPGGAQCVRHRHWRHRDSRCQCEAGWQASDGRTAVPAWGIRFRVAGCTVSHSGPNSKLQASRSS